ncbi:MAG: hypothetical protein SO047_02630 [Ruminococcus bovis]|nr:MULTISPECIES: hypothetical protein [Ruminococcus]MCI5617902.1 hypothetical protein [Ruminococcus sp.]MDY3661760.1 hypothetical protein [Ruminococcus bovis]DAY67918.1 MAG TPA: hypothetical protein [Caudoviricetes sp.]
MDLLFKRYASPFLLIEQMIAINSFSDFVTKLINLNDEDILWEFFLHKYMGEQSYSEWKESLESKEVSAEEAEKIISNSFDILNSFEPS